jgi:HTH-type transcriptional regulator, sugar sensing transcriptional regulator
MVEPLAPHTLLALRRIGLTEYEARAYHALLVLGRADGTSVSKASGIPPTRVNAVLRDLHRKQWTLVESGRPVIYIPRPPRERLDAEWSEATQVFEMAVTDLEMAYAGRSMAASSPVWFIRGQNAIEQRSLEIIDSARQQIAVTLPFLMGSDKEKFMHSLRRSARAGRRVRLIVSPDIDMTTDPRPWSLLLEAGVEIRVFPAVIRLVMSDFESALMMSPSNKKEKMVAIWNPVREFVHATAPSFEQMWDNGQSVVSRMRGKILLTKQKGIKRALRF